MGVVEFTVFGPLEAIKEGRQVRLGGPKPRALLAALLLADGRFVNVEMLVDALWSDKPPGGAVKAVQKYVSVLRQQIGTPGLIVSRPQGYEIHTASLDVRRFDRLIAEADAATAPQDKVSCLDEALALWRGEPFVDLGDLPAARVERRRLQERRLSAVEALAEVRLGLGQHAALVGWLEEQAAECPLRERLWGQLMLAMYRCGRQADALATYHRLRAALVEDLGVEPARDVRRLFERMLHQDAALAPDVTIPAPPGSRPNSRVAAGGLPRQLTKFIGRGAELNELDTVMDAHCAVTLTGGAGCGKTRLALEVAGRRAGRYRHGVWLVELAGLTTPNQVPLAVAATFGLGEQAGRPLPDILIDHLRDKELLLLLDNAEHLVEPVAELVDRLLQAAARVQVVATSRQPLGVAGEAAYDVSPLPVPPSDTAADIASYDSVRLLIERARAADSRFIATAETAGGIARICRRLDGIPLALELAAARLRTYAPERLADLLDDRFDVLPPPCGGRRPATRRCAPPLDGATTC